MSTAIHLTELEAMALAHRLVGIQVSDTEDWLMFTHARCGGNLIPILDPAWFYRRGPGKPGGAASSQTAEFTRCDKCGHAGEMAEPRAK